MQQEEWEDQMIVCLNNLSYVTATSGYASNGYYTSGLSVFYFCFISNLELKQKKTDFSQTSIPKTCILALLCPLFLNYLSMGKK